MTLFERGELFENGLYMTPEKPITEKSAMKKKLIHNLIELAV